MKTKLTSCAAIALAFITLAPVHGQTPTPLEPYPASASEVPIITYPFLPKRPSIPPSTASTGATAPVTPTLSSAEQAIRDVRLRVLLRHYEIAVAEAAEARRAAAKATADQRAALEAQASALLEFVERLERDIRHPDEIAKKTSDQSMIPSEARNDAGISYITRAGRYGIAPGVVLAITRSPRKNGTGWQYDAQLEWWKARERQAAYAYEIALSDGEPFVVGWAADGKTLWVSCEIARLANGSDEGVTRCIRKLSIKARGEVDENAFGAKDGGDFGGMPAELRRVFEAAEAAKKRIGSDSWRSDLPAETPPLPLGHEYNAGIGVALARKNGHVVITSILPDSPALDGSLKPNDRILRIGGGEDSWTVEETIASESKYKSPAWSLDKWDLEDVVAGLRGVEGTKVSLFIVPAGKALADGYKITLTRSRLPMLPDERSVRRAREALAVVRARFEAGYAPMSEFIEAQLEVALAEAHGDPLRQAQAKLTIAVQTLQYMETRYAAGILTEAELSRAKQRMREAEIDLQRVKGH